MYEVPWRYVSCMSMARVKVIKEPSFANIIKYANHQFYRDSIASHMIGRLPKIAYERLLFLGILRLRSCFGRRGEFVDPNTYTVRKHRVWFFLAEWWRQIGLLTSQEVKMATSSR